jgi:NAD(P)-dependent dehydrogenase (short-subunit alcohol dehydrogenase family)
MTDLSSKIVLVTGAAARIGRAIALDLAEAGWTVAVHYGDSGTAAEDTVNAIRDAGGTAMAFAADLSDEDQTARLIGQVAEALGPVNCLINNASIFEDDTAETATKESWDNHMSVNLRAPFVLSQAMAAAFTNQESGNIINLIDQRVFNLTPYFMSYTLSKAGLWTLTQTLALSFAPNIRVNAIGPGPTLPSSRQSEEQFRRQFEATPLERPVDPTEICGAVRFILASPSMTGQMIALDSGQHLGWGQPPKGGAADE